jgi:acetoin utilization deacetylase AcuC-like enzyme
MQLLLTYVQMLEANPIDIEIIKLAHNHSYVDRFCAGALTEQEQRTIGFPLSADFVHRTLVITGATLAATAFALRHPGGLAANMAGGTHHAFAARGEGYCIFNDLAVAAQWALQRGHASHVAVVDLDVHQGNGTADMLRGVQGASTLSVHAEKNYPWKSRSPSCVDVGVEDDISAEGYLRAVQEGLQQLETYWSSAQLPVPDLVFFQAGVDPLKQDRLGRLQLTRSDLRARNELVLSWVQGLERRFSLQRLPMVVTMGGGYSAPISHSARAHVDVFAQAASLHRDRLLHRADRTRNCSWSSVCEILDGDHDCRTAASEAFKHLHLPR